MARPAGFEPAAYGLEVRSRATFPDTSQSRFYQHRYCEARVARKQFFKRLQSFFNNSLKFCALFCAYRLI